MNKARLAIDHGNTRLKATIFRDVEAIATFTLERMDCDRLLEWMLPYDVQSAIYASTAGVDVRLAETLERMLPGGCIVLTGNTPLPIGIDYATPATLGADRIAAAVGAASMMPGRRLLVADAGTCITLDLVSDGRFKGGNISPGVQMRFRAMHEYSGALPLVSAQPDLCPKVSFGRDTTEALKCGVLHGIVDEIKGACQRATQAYGETHVLLTGGDAPLLAPMLHGKIPCTVSDKPVMLGLITILLYNEGRHASGTNIQDAEIRIK